MRGKAVVSSTPSSNVRSRGVPVAEGARGHDNPIGPESTIGLYVHVPFCQTKCSYCNFNTYAHLEALMPDYAGALSAEARWWGAKLGRPQVATMFLGGGTPSWLPVEQFCQVMTACREAFALQENAEVTAEANPGDITRERLEAWARLGVNRLSVGVQSLDDGLLEALTRRHTAAEALRALDLARQAGFENLSLDLIYGLPTQTLAQWKDTLERALEVETAHLSLYGLTVEEGTPLWQAVESGEAPRPDPDLAADMYVLAEELLAEAGYDHYEISNWAKPGNECRHNLVYWRNEPFLGLGPGAHSYLQGERFWTIKSPTEYVRRLTHLDDAAAPEATAVIEERRRLTAAEVVSETLILQLRLDEGLDTAALARRLGPEAMAGPLETLREFASIGFLTEEDGTFRLTSRGRLLSNELFVQLLPS